MVGLVAIFDMLGANPNLHNQKKIIFLRKCIAMYTYSFLSAHLPSVEGESGL